MTATGAAPPRYSHFDLPGDLHLAINSNRKMKTVLVTAAILGNLGEDVTRIALLPMILRRGTRSHPDMQAISRHLEDLYGASLSSHVHKIGEWHAVYFRMEVVNEKFLPREPGLLRKALDLFREVITSPVEVAGGFAPEPLEQEKSNLRQTIESLVDNKAAYADHRLIEEMCRGEPYSIHEQGRVADIPAIDAVSLRETHRRWIRRQPMHVYVAGDIEVRATRDLVASLCGGMDREGGYPLTGLPRPVPVCKLREVDEHMDVNQARLAMGFRHGITYGDPAYEALLVMNGILGGFSHSKLFQNVREKANLCYGVHSWLERTKGLLLISSGIAPENHKRAQNIILEQVGALQRGDISDHELDATLLSILNANEMLEDNLGALGDVDLVWRLHGREVDLLAFRERLRRVRRDDIVHAARSLQHDTTYLLTR
jgi:predicted Zn-dependent peptidase